MKYFVVASLFLTILSVGSSSVNAQTSTPTVKITSARPTRTITPLKDREELKKRIEARREAVKTRIQTRREALAEKLENFKDQRKAQIAERVSDNLGTINTKRVEMMLHSLTQMQELLDKVKTRVAEKGEGKDLTSINTAIVSAQTAIDKAKSALETQAGKDYTLTVSDESQIRTVAQASRNSLHTDLKALHALVVEARKAVANAIRTAYSVLGKQNVDDGVTPSPSVTLTPSPSVTPTPSPSVTLTPTP